MKAKLVRCKHIISECKELAKKRAEESEEDSKDMMIWLNCKIELTDIEYRLKDMIQYLPKDGE